MFLSPQTPGTIRCYDCGDHIAPTSFGTCQRCHHAHNDVTRHLSRPDSDRWTARVQLRQDLPHRRTFFYLEQLILKHRAAAMAIKILETSKGLDFIFTNEGHALSFVEFVASVLPVEYRPDKRLVNIAPISREDLICLPPDVSCRLVGLGPLVVCTQITSSIALMDVNPLSPKVVHLDAKEYWKSEFKAMLTTKQLVEYIVLDVDVLTPATDMGGLMCCFAYVDVARVSDFGKNDTAFTVATHLGHVLRPGDRVLGYHLYGADLCGSDIEKYHDVFIPDVILVKKNYDRGMRRGQPRAWKLKRLNMEVDESAEGGIDEEKRDEEYEEFLNELEENLDLKFNICLYPNEDHVQSDMALSIDADDDAPTVVMEELLADLDLRDAGNGDTNMMIE